MLFLFFSARYCLGGDREKEIGVPHSDGRISHGFAEECRMGTGTRKLKAEKTSSSHNLFEWMQLVNIFRFIHTQAEPPAQLWPQDCPSAKTHSRQVGPATGPVEKDK